MLWHETLPVKYVFPPGSPLLKMLVTSLVDFLEISSLSGKEISCLAGHSSWCGRLNLYLTHFDHLKELGLDTQKAHKTVLKLHTHSVLCIRTDNN